MRPRTLAITALAAGVLTLGVGASLLPLSLALSLSGAQIEGRPSGRVWDGRIEDARAGGLDLGTLTLRPRALPLLTGRLAGAFAIDGPSGTGAGEASARNGVLTLDRYEGTVMLSALGARDAFGQPLGGEAQVSARSLRLTEAGCQAGTLAVTTDALTQTARRLGGFVEGPVLSGQGACEGGVLDLPLTGRGADGEAEARLRLNGRRYTTELILRPGDPRAGRALAAYGFQRTPDGYSVVTRGAF